MRKREKIPYLLGGSSEFMELWRVRGGYEIRDVCPTSPKDKVWLSKGNMQILHWLLGLEEEDNWP